MEIKDKAGVKNVATDHMSSLIIESQDVPLNNAFPYEHLLAFSTEQAPWFTNIANYLASRILHHDLFFHQKRKFFYDVRLYFWDEPFLYKLCKDDIYRRCLPKEIQSVISHYHDSPCGAHASTSKTAANVLQVGIFWPSLFKDVHTYVRSFDRYQ